MINSPYCRWVQLGLTQWKKNIGPAKHFAKSLDYRGFFYMRERPQLAAGSNSVFILGKPRFS